MAEFELRDETEDLADKGATAGGLDRVRVGGGGCTAADTEDRDDSGCFSFPSGEDGTLRKPPLNCKKSPEAVNGVRSLWGGGGNRLSFDGFSLRGVRGDVGVSSGNASDER
jgi:hypothetical protein